MVKIVGCRVSRLWACGIMLSTILWAMSGSGCYQIYMNLGLLFGNDFTLKIDTVAEDLSAMTSVPAHVSDDAYLPADGPTYSLSFSENGATVTLSGATDEPLIGTRSVSDSGDFVRYELSTSLLSPWGRLTVWIEGDSFEAEYLLYGSGVPVLKSERGTLSIKPKSAASSRESDI